MADVAEVDDKAPPTLAELLTLLPQQPPFRFIDEFLEVSERHSVARYTFRPDEPFYAGHFPKYPVTPGVILLEMMAQATQAFVIAWAIKAFGRSALDGAFGVFAGAEGVEFLQPVLPGTTLTAHCELIFSRMRLIRSRSELRDAQGRTVARATTTAAVMRTDERPLPHRR